ncbi:hypothetical protein [Methylocystis bryophila]|uniref:PEP-CTERM sorting domain-containing protein n=1 Tax=Methylocystis bryophila TaxID=655015 RepID=A0A1W6N051_9HYPH|nr:hypothetical protein [Methylocystis bryophila]ARN83179.1 hypothetical protein B1812_21215 [Methylocystis bryophila]BDV39515.1 hypothetical protein DSM21852_27680 [Methylocystis bryophila]
MQTTKLSLVAAVAAFIASPAAAASVDISGLTNADIQGYTNGSNYPLGGSTVTISGIGFQLTTLNGNPNSTGVIQTPSGDSSFTINVNQANVGTVYTLINSGFGVLAGQNGALVFADSAGDSYTYNLTEGDNVRDHYNGLYINTAPNIFGTAQFNGDVRLDAQKIVLPVGFDSSTLTTITFEGLNAGIAGGEPFLAAITTQTAAAPGPTPGAGFAGIAALLAWVAFGKRQQRA